jgi:hypothetical protein
MSSGQHRLSGPLHSKHGSGCELRSRTKKNKTDNGHTLGHIRARHLIAFSAAIVVPMEPFLASKGHPAEVVNRMYDAAESR